MQKQSHMKKQSYGWMRRLLIMACIVGIFSIGCSIKSDAASYALEELFSYEESEDGAYLIITGIAKDQGTFQRHMEIITGEKGILRIPTNINGIPVKEIGANAFANKRWIQQVDFSDLSWGIEPDEFPNTGLPLAEDSCELETIGEEAFAGCALTAVRMPASVHLIGERAFAENPALWAVLIPDVSAVIAKDAFADCKRHFVLCYGDNPQGKDNLVAAYAKANGMGSVEILVSKDSVVRYPEEPLILESKVGNFFYGDGCEEMDNWGEYDENAPNFGYIEWQAPCSSWCGVGFFRREAHASSTLPSQNGRYSADNILEENRKSAWAENAAGGGIGESITYRQCCSTETRVRSSKKSKINVKWDEWDEMVEPLQINTFMSYTEICIVNGYAKDEKTWEENGRIKQLLMYVEDVPYAYLELEDTILPQYFALPEDDIKVLNGGTIEVRFEITQVYPGSVYEDTCLTGLIMEFSGRHGH